MTPRNWNKPFDKAQIKILREIIDSHADEPYDLAWRGSINWLWISQAVAAMEQGLE